MEKCLEQICKDFEETKGYLKEPTPEKIELVNNIFHRFMDCFLHIGAQKLDFPKEFNEDVRLYNQGNEKLITKYKDVDIRYLMLSDFYDYARLTKLYKK